MAPQEWQKIKQIFEAASDLPESERTAFVRERCQDSPTMLAEVLSLLAQKEGLTLLSQAGPELFRQWEDDPDTPPLQPGDRIGAYGIVAIIGQGGMGTVFEATRADEEFQQRVALKVMKRGMDNAQITRRFRNERQILASLDHPNIAHLLDGGLSEDGQPYFVMELVHGVPIDRFCTRQKLDLEGRLRLFGQVCEAVQFAHQNLVVHRDLKPGNVLVKEDGLVKLLDFGIAKLLDSTAEGGEPLQTQTGMRLMTLEYASPEQILQNRITTASDIYSLGVMLFELLTGRRPFSDAETNLATLSLALTTRDPPRPSTAVPAEPRLRRQLAGDLDTIVLKALQKEPERRYQSVHHLQEDIERYLTGLPVLARPDTLRYRAWKYVNRHRAGVASAALLLAVIAAGASTTVLQWMRAEEQRAVAARRFGDVRHLADAFLFEFHESIRNLPGSTAARRLIVTKAQEYLIRLQSEKKDDPALLMEVAMAYMKVGDIQGDPFGQNLGDSKGAFESYRKALAAAESAHAANPANPEWSRNLGDIHLKIGDLAQFMKTDTDVGAHYRVAQVFFEQARPAQHGDRAVRHDLTKVYQRLGDLSAAKGDLADAARQKIKAVQILRVLAGEEPRDANAQNDLGVGLSTLADTLAAQGHAEEAARAYRESLESRQRAARLDAANTALLRSLAIGNDKLGTFYRLAGNLEAALPYYRESMSIRRGMVAADPLNAMAQRDLYVTLTKLGSLYFSRRQLAEATNVFGEAAAITERLLAQNPSSKSSQRDVAIVEDRLADTKLAARDFAGALASNGRSLKILEAFANEPSATPSAIGDFAYGLAKRAEIVSKQGSATATVGLLSRALELRKKVVTASPSNVQFRRECAETQALLAAALEKAGDKRAVQVRRQAITEFANLAQTAGASPQDHHGYARLLLQDRGLSVLDLQPALLHARQAAQQTGRSNPEFLDTLAEAASRAGALEEARAATESAARLRRTTASSGP